MHTIYVTSDWTYLNMWRGKSQNVELQNWKYATCLCIMIIETITWLYYMTRSKYPYMREKLLPVTVSRKEWSQERSCGVSWGLQESARELSCHQSEAVLLSPLLVGNHWIIGFQTGKALRWSSKCCLRPRLTLNTCIHDGWLTCLMQWFCVSSRIDYAFA